MACLVLVASCSNVEDQIEGQIPDDALVVVKANAAQLIKHLGIDQRDGKMVVPQQFEQLMGLSSQDIDELKQNLDKVANSGIDFGHCCYIYVPNGAQNSGGDMQAVMLVPVSDEAKLKAFLADMAQIDLKDSGGMQVGTWGETIIGLTDGILYVGTGNGAANPGAQLKTLASVSRGMSGNKAMVGALDTGDDINIYLNAAKLKNTVAREVCRQGGAQTMAVGTAIDMWDAQSTAIHINLADNEWNMRCDNKFDNDSEYLKLVKQVTAKPDNAMLAQMPMGANAAALSVSLNGEGIAQLDMVKALLANLDDSPEVQAIVDIVKSINGPIMLGIASDTMNPEEANFVLAAKCNNAAKVMSNINQYLPLAGPMTQRGDELVAEQQVMGGDLAMGAKGNEFYVKLTHSDMAANMSNAGEARTAMAGSVAALYLSSTVGNKQMQLVIESKDLTDASAKLWVTEGGKKLSILDALAFFAELGQNVSGR